MVQAVAGKINEKAPMEKRERESRVVAMVLFVLAFVCAEEC